MLSILVPVRNESNSLDDLYNYFDKNLVGMHYEIIIINDFSDDDTFEKANLLPQKNSNFKVFNNKKKGLGGAINLGVEVAKGDFISIMMADQSDEINDLKKYYDIIKSENLDAVLGSRFMKDSKVIGYP